ncbi:MAG: DNA polymerase III subunit gamma/tau, partial [Desulfovibrionales bacterium]|nr:DNA polymerase III subunit gamma/tau [Desulfovibrionales bacterium]
IPALRIHAAWQMVIEEQKSILKSNEPALAMELLFFNLAYLPELLPIAQYNPPREETGNSTAANPADPGEKKSPENIGKPLDISELIPGYEPEKEESCKDFSKKDWPGFINYCRSKEGGGDSLARMLDSCESIIEQGSLKLVCNQEFIYDSLKRNGRERFIAGLIGEFFGSEMALNIINNGQKKDSSFREKALDHPVVKRLVDEFDSRIIEIKRL